MLACNVGESLLSDYGLKRCKWLLPKLDPFELKRHRFGFAMLAPSQTLTLSSPAVRGMVVPRKSLTLAVAWHLLLCDPPISILAVRGLGAWGEPFTLEASALHTGSMPSM